MNDLGIKGLTALRLTVGFVVLVSWGLVFSLYNPMQASADMFDVSTVAYNIDYTNMLICGLFAAALGSFFFGITFLEALKSLAIAPSREHLYSDRLFRFVGFIALAFGMLLIIYSVAKPF